MSDADPIFNAFVSSPISQDTVDYALFMINSVIPPVSPCQENIDEDEITRREAMLRCICERLQLDPEKIEESCAFYRRHQMEFLATRTTHLLGSVTFYMYPGR
jgi:hypothetical protein